MSGSAGSLLDALRTVMASSNGALPGAAIERLGGWQRVATEIGGTLDNSMSVVLVRLIAHDAASGGDEAAAALPAIVDAVLAMDSPAGFADCLDALLTSPAVLDVAAERLADGLLAQVSAFAGSVKLSVPEVARTASALEAATRLKVGGYGTPFGLLAALERFRAPVPSRLAAAVVRSVGTAADYWPDAASLAAVVKAVAGVAPPTGPQIEEADPEDVASDASWVLANIELVQALRVDSKADMIAYLEESHRYLTTGAETYGRDDAKVLAPVVAAIAALMRAEGQSPLEALDTAMPTADAFEGLVEQQVRFNMGLSGLDHWYADVKRQTTAAWVMLVEDLVRAQEQFGQESFYTPEATIDDLLQVYRASRSVEVVRRDDDFDGVLTVVQPIIEAGFASKAAFVANLDIYTRELAVRVKRARDQQRAYLVEEHDVAAQVLQEARAMMASGRSPGKDDGGATTASLPHQLEQIFGAGTPEAAKVVGLGEEAVRKLLEAVGNKTAARHITLQEQATLESIEQALASSPDYADEVKTAVDEVVLQLVRFVGRLQNAQSDVKAYLFDPNAKEKALQNDLHQYLWSALGPSVDIEVPQIGGGRVDLRVKYTGFSIYLELKVDDTKKPMFEKTAYLSQAATYQATDIRIGFVVALRTKAFPQPGAHPHLTSLFTHATVEVSGDDVPRHLVLVEVPGNRSSPAAKKGS